MTKNEAIEFFGSKLKLSEALGIKHQAITGWGDYPPDGRQWQIQVLTKNKLKVTPAEEQTKA